MTQIISNLLAIVGILVLITLMFGLPTMILWNWLMPILFNIPEVTFWQACGLQILISLLLAPSIFKTNND
jgi:hypothetical protein